MSSIIFKILTTAALVQPHTRIEAPICLNLGHTFFFFKLLIGLSPHSASSIVFICIKFDLIRENHSVPKVVRLVSIFFGDFKSLDLVYFADIRFLPRNTTAWYNLVLC